MYEVFSWMEGSVHIWTGSASASAVVAFAQNVQGNPQYGMQSDAAASGRYFMHSTGRRFDLTIGALYTYDATLARMAASARSDVHVKLLHTGIHGSAGYLLYSGAIDALPFQGNEGAPYSYQLVYHCHSWKPFGG